MLAAKIDQEEVLTGKEVAASLAAFLKLKPNTITCYLSRGQIPLVPIEIGPSIRFRKSDVMRLMVCGNGKEGEA